ncbi:hypothetical protein D3C78_943420 [compost metagenome]
MRHQHIEQLFIKLFFKRQRFTFGGENFVLILFQFRNDITLGVLKCLTTDIVNRGVVALTTADLNVIAVNSVIADFQRIQTQTLALADFQFIEVIRCAVGQGSPFIEFLVIARSNDAAITNQNRWGFNNRVLQ